MRIKGTLIPTLLVTLVLLALALLFPLGQEAPPPGQSWLPWQIERVDGTTRVFGLTLGRSTLSEAEAKFAETAEVSLFAGRDGGGYAVEGYFDEVVMGGLRAKVVVSVALEQGMMARMFDRGARVATVGSGERKVTLHPDDVDLVKHSPIGSLTYLPRANLDEATLRKRFGEPARRVEEPQGAVVHLLYPEIGLDIAVSEKEKETFQYVPPADFERLTAPLARPPGV